MSFCDPVLVANVLRETNGAYPLPQRAARERWQVLRATALGHEILCRAEAALSEPTPPLPASFYLAFHRSGAREPYEQPSAERRERLTLFALAECLEAKGRFLDAVLDEAWAICEESTWVTVGHGFDWQRELPEPGRPIIDLFSAITAAALAEIDYLLDDALHPVLRDRIRCEIERRSTGPFLARDDYPWLGLGAKKSTTGCRSVLAARR
ncbi:hypothetical protein HC891_25615 [Candidatus Gracilibacteria bacterium]|nr:hypothetical protein [Candidatus Gracilibacteria bacterium]